MNNFCLENDDSIVTVYEMKMKQITALDIDIAVDKIIRSPQKIHNYIFITTETIDESVVDYACKIYDKTGGVEVTILDCLGFLEHFLFFFTAFVTNL